MFCNTVVVGCSHEGCGLLVLRGATQPLGQGREVGGRQKGGRGGGR